ncbi:MAG: glucose-6-phosphate isomerase family protein [Candidatus Pacearchaeota archaeon]
MNYSKTIREFEKNYDFKKTKRLKEMAKYYGENVRKNNKIVYEVYIKKFSPVQIGLTEVHSGSINNEFYMTSGHIHKNKTPEFYILLEGKGILLIQKNDKVKAVPLKKGKINLIPEGYAHRLINTGDKKLKVLTIYHENSKPYYNIKFNKKFFRKNGIFEKNNH